MHIQYMMADKMPNIFYADIESLIIKIDGLAYNPENSSTTKIGQHIPFGYSMSKIWAFDYTEDKHTLIAEKIVSKSFLLL